MICHWCHNQDILEKFATSGQEAGFCSFFPARPLLPSGDEMFGGTIPTGLLVISHQTFFPPCDCMPGAASGSALHNSSDEIPSNIQQANSACIASSSISHRTFGYFPPDFHTIKALRQYGRRRLPGERKLRSSNYSRVILSLVPQGRV